MIFKKKLIVYLAMIGVIFAAYIYSVHSSTRTSTTECPDILALYQKQIEHVEFTHCINHYDGQTKRVAHYIVQGDKAAIVENVLVNEYGMSRLNHAGTGWSSGKFGSITSNGTLYTIKMYAEVFSNQTPLSEIPYVNIEVTEIMSQE